MAVCDAEHIHPQLGHRTSQQVHQAQTFRHLPADFRAHVSPLPIAVGKVTFIRRVRRSGRMTILGEKVHASKRLRGQYVRATLYTRSQTLTMYAGRKLLKRVPYRIRGLPELSSMF
jgi:hypothetical protein